MPDDHELLRRYAEEGAEEAFAALVQRHVDLVYAVARRKAGGDPNLAREATQQVFTALARKAGTLRGHAVLTGWLFTSARYAAAQLVRAERRRRLIEGKAQTMQDLLREDEPAAAIDWDRLRPQLDDLIGELGERDREVVLLRFFEDRPYGEIGQRLRLSEEGARSRLERALEKLRRSLARRGVTSTGSALALALNGQTGLAAPTGLAAAISGPALAGVAATTGAGATASLLTFMNTTKITVGIAALVTALAIGFGTRERMRTEETAAKHAGALSENAALQARVRELESHPLNVAMPAPGRVPELRPASAAPASGEPGAIPDESLDRFVAAHPDLQKLYLRQITLRTASSYGPFYQAAKLTPPQVAAFEKAVAVCEQALLDIAAVAIEQGLDKNSPRLKQLRDTAREERDRALRTTLGPNALAAFGEYQKTLLMRDVANYVAGELYYTPTPLTAEQADALTRIVAQSRRDGKGVETWDLIVERAQEGKFLSSEQLAVLAVRRDQMKLGQEIHAALAPLRAAHQPGPAMSRPGDR